MVIVLWDVVIVVGTLILSALAFADELSKYRLFIGLKDNTPIKALIFAFGSGLIIWATIRKGIDSQDQSNNDKAELKAQNEIASRELVIRDSVHQIKEDSIAHLYFDKLDSSKQSTAELLARYHFKIDSANDRVIKVVRDSAKTTVINGADPSFSLCVPNGITILEIKNLTDYRMEMGLCNKYAVSRDIKIKTYIIAKSGRNIAALPRRASYNFSKMEAGQELNINVPAIRIESNTDSLNLFILLKGSFKNSDRSKSFDIDELYQYSVKGRYLGVASAYENAFVRAFVNRVPGLK
jgi:hypothetical protein